MQTVNVTSKLSQTTNDDYIKDIAKTLSRKVTNDILKERYAGTADVLKFVGAGAFLAASIAIPNLPKVLKPFLDENAREEREAWKRFNIPYLKRTLKRLEKQKLVKFSQKNGQQVVEITKAGQKKILHFALNELAISKPSSWGGSWYLVSYDIPQPLSPLRNVLREYLTAWGFYPLHESMFLHCYPCEKELTFLREYLGVGEYVNFFKVSYIENDQAFRDFFGV